MGNPRVRGLIFLAVGVIVAWLICVWLPFTVLPNAGISPALPVITVPPEIVVYGSLPITNTYIAALLTIAITALWVGMMWRNTNGWKKEIPDRWQGLTEVFVETFYNFCNGLGGEKFRKAPFLWPLVASIFFFLLIGNWMEILPGVESVGYMHCSYPNTSGYARSEMGVPNTWKLHVDRILDAGVTSNEELEADCIHFSKVTDSYYNEYDPADYATDRAAHCSSLATFDDNLPGYCDDIEIEAASADVQTLLMSNSLAEEVEEAAADEVAGADLIADGLCEVPGLGAEAEAGVLGEEAAADAAVEGEAEDHGEEAAEDEAAEEGDAEGTDEAEAGEGEEAASLLLMGNRNTEAVEEGDEAEEDHSEEELKREYVFGTPDQVAVAFAELEEAEEAFAAGEISAGALEEASCEATQMVYPNAVFPLSSGELENNRIFPYISHITPFVRVVATDLSLNFGMAILAIIAVQAYGVWALGPAYFEKFINLPALGNIGSRPIGGVDFVVGIIEIVSEIGKIVSLSFRLFGNIFAGGIVLMVFPFLLAFVVPGIMIGLEIIIGFVQALVFAVLTLVFSVQAMEAHHGDDHDDEHH
jgi:F0F1-type ATP synthase membrane subunit a